MQIFFENRIAEQQFCSKHKKKWRYPSQVIEKLQATENFLQQASSLHDVFQYRPFRFHSLKGDRKNEWSIRLGNTGYRVIVKPCDDKGKIIVNMDIMAESKRLKVVMVTEVSNHYE